jgi:hypothetical protein
MARRSSSARDVGQYHHRVDPGKSTPAPAHLEEKREAIRRVRDCKDIVRGFDDELDLSWWKDAFKVLKPPFAEDDGGDGDD